MASARHSVITLPHALLDLRAPPVCNSGLAHLGPVVEVRCEHCTGNCYECSDNENAFHLSYLLKVTIAFGGKIVTGMSSDAPRVYPGSLRLTKPSCVRNNVCSLPKLAERPMSPRIISWVELLGASISPMSTFASIFLTIVISSTPLPIHLRRRAVVKRPRMGASSFHPRPTAFLHQPLTQGPAPRSHRTCVIPRDIAQQC